jgi:hypothetical protein
VLEFLNGETIFTPDGAWFIAIQADFINTYSVSTASTLLPIK